MVELCGCLLEVATPSSGNEATVPSRIGAVRADHFVQLLHQTSIDYLLRPGQAGPFGIDRYQANNLLAFVSLRYLMLSIPMEALQYRNLEDWTKRDYEAFVGYLVDRPLLGYVIEYLSYHMMEAATDETQSLLSSYMTKLLCQRKTHGWALLSKMKQNSEQSMPDTDEEKARVKFRTECLTLACKLGQAAVVRLMLKLMADPYLAVDGDRTPLQCAVSTGSKAVVQMLLEGIDIDSSLGSFYVSEGLYTAVENGYEDLVRLFLSKGCDVEVMGSRGSVLNVAVQNGHIRIAELLITQGVNLENRNLDGLRPVHVAATKGHNVSVQLLLEKGANIGATAKERETALHMAPKGGHDVVASTLLNHGAEIEQMTEYGEPPLHRAAQYGRTTVAQVLLDRKADIEVKANYGKIPL
jgi:ankyrin repeat protein